MKPSQDNTCCSVPCHSSWKVSVVSCWWPRHTLAISGIRLFTTGLTTGIKNLTTSPNSALRKPPFCRISLLFQTWVFFFESASMSFACQFSNDNWWSVNGMLPFNRFAAISNIESHSCREQYIIAPLLSSFASGRHLIIKRLSLSFLLSLERDFLDLIMLSSIVN